MTIPANIVTELQFLQSQVAKASPLSTASRATITALQLNAAKLVKDAEAAQYSLAGVLDTWIPPTDPVAIINGILGIDQNAQDEADITALRGLVGRAADNLDQLP